MSRLLLKNAQTLLGNGKVDNVDIAISGEVVAEIGHLSGKTDEYDQIIDCTGMMAVPGFINTHTHAAMTLFRSYADDMLLMDWLQNKIWPAEANLTEDDVYWGTMLAIAEMIRSGTTTFADMYFFMPSVARAVSESGIRAVLSRGMAGVAPNAQQALVESEAFYNEFNNSAEGRIKVMLGPHAPYTCPPDYLKKVIALSQRLGAEIHIHLAETIGEVQECYKKYGVSPIKLMYDIGLLDCGVLAAHCVHLSENDMDLMQKCNVRVAHNPGSNMKLASGVAPIPQLLNKGICVGLGTDGAASNNNLDMLEEVQLVALLHKVTQLNSTVIPATLAVEMATKQGAKALGLDKYIGSIAVGMKADIVLLETSGFHWYPRHDMVSLLTYSAKSSDVNTVLVNGKILMRNRVLTTIDEEKLVFEVGARANRLVQ